MNTIRRALHSNINNLIDIDLTLVSELQFMTEEQRKLTAAELMIQQRKISTLIANLLDGVSA